MRILLLSLLFLPRLALAGDIWMTVDEKDDEGLLQVDVSAGWMLTQDQAMPARQGDREVDLRTEVAALMQQREGAKASYVVKNDGGEPLTLTLHHRARKGSARVTHLDVALGSAFALSLPLDDGGGAAAIAMVGPAFTASGTTQLSGLDFQDAPTLDALRHAGPRTLVRLVDDHGDGLMVTTR